MSLLDKIPMPGTFFEGLGQGQDLMNNFLKAPVERRKLEAEAQRQEALSKLPFGGQQLSGKAGEIMGLERIKGLYGEDSTQYKEAKKAFDLQQEHTEGLTNYQRLLTESLPKRTSTQLAKTDQEINNIKEGFYPGTKKPIESKEEQERLLGQYQLKQQKSVTDTDTRKRNLFAQNVEETIKSINPKSLTQYSGPKGLYNFNKDRYMDSQGKPPQRYIEYTNAQKNAVALGKQLTQFWGVSIQPSMQEKIDKMINPETWYKSPTTALSNYNAVVKTLRRELNIFKGALKSTDAYQGNNNNGENNEPDKNGKVILYRGKDEYKIPANEMNEALNSGGFSLEPR